MRQVAIDGFFVVKTKKRSPDHWNKKGRINKDLYTFLNRNNNKEGFNSIKELFIGGWMQEVVCCVECGNPQTIAR